MGNKAGGWEPSQLREFRAELQANPALCERALALLREPTPEPKCVLVRCSRENVDRAILRALARAVIHRGVCEIEIEKNDAETKI
jgi:hypothetical protein